MHKGILQASLCAVSALALSALSNSAMAQPAAAPAAAAQPAAACAALKRLAQVKMQRSATGQEWVPVQINGQEKYLMLQTAAAHTSLDKPAAGDLQIATGPTAKGAAPGGRGGFGKSEVAPVQSFQLGKAEFGASNLNVNAKASPDYAVDKKFAGTLAGDTLGLVDYDMDFGADTLSLFVPDHCEGGVVYWTAPAVVTVPLTYDRQGRAHLPVTVDGVRFDAMLDTGSATTVINMPSVASEALKANVDDPDVKKVVVGTSLSFEKTYHTLDLGGIAVTNPVIQLSVSPVLKELHKSDVGKGPPELEAQRPVDISIGMNVLSKLHIYVATREHKLYISPAAPPA